MATLLLWFDVVLVTVFSLHVLSRPSRTPSKITAWLLLFLLIPVGGVTLYLLFGYRYRLRAKVSSQHQDWQCKRGHERDTSCQEQGQSVPIQYQGVSRTIESLVDFSPVPSFDIQVSDESYETYEALEHLISKAKESIHVEFYIFRDDEAGRRFGELLMERARTGVVVRLLVDHVGSFGLSEEFIGELITAGVQFSFFWPLQISRPWGFHLRNHRKIVIVDSTRAFIGSQNISDEYFNWRRRKQSWRDLALFFRGEAARQLQTVFLEDWTFATGVDLRIPESEESEGESPSDGLMQVIPSGPTEEESGLEKVLLTIVYAARERIRIITPYFVPSQAVMLALSSAISRGVTVELIVPKKTDHWFVQQAAQGWYASLLEVGGEIYFYEERFLHAKVIVVDEELALMGSANMDERSFRINFECSVVLYSKEWVKKFLSSFEDLKKSSEVLERNRYSEAHFFERVRITFFRSFSPLL